MLAMHYSLYSLRIYQVAVQYKITELICLRMQISIKLSGNSADFA